jgi:hypothetical protein
MGSGLGHREMLCDSLGTAGAIRCQTTDPRPTWEANICTGRERAYGGAGPTRGFAVCRAAQFPAERSQGPAGLVIEGPELFERAGPTSDFSSLSERRFP